MFGSSSTSERDSESSLDSDPLAAANSDTSRLSQNNGEKASNGSPLVERTEGNSAGDRKRRSSGVAKARDIISNARQSLHLRSSSPKATGSPNRGTFRVLLSDSDPALGVPSGSMNNSAGESVPGPRSTFRVGVTEDKNKKCRRTMEDTHAYLYNFLSTPAPAVGGEVDSKPTNSISDGDAAEPIVQETDNGYFAIFDGHAGTFAADWCGKKLHLILEDTIRKNPNTPLPELLDQTFTIVDQQLEKLPLKNSGCTAAIAVLRWEDRVPNPASATGSTYINQAAAKSISESKEPPKTDSEVVIEVPASQQNSETPITNTEPVHESASLESKLRDSASRQRVLYTANVGDARIVLCRNGRALRLSYDHKGSDENEGRRVANAGGLILNNRVNGVLAVTRALGDAYMKDLVTGHPYTTETVIQPDQDEFIILACDGLWDVCSDQEAADLVRHIQDPQVASKQLVDHALARFSTDNLSCMIVRFDNDALKARRLEASIGVQGDATTGTAGESEADALVDKVKRHIDETGEMPGGTVTAREEMADIPEEREREHGVEEGSVEDVTQSDLNEQVLEEARKKARKHGDGAEG